MLLYKSLCRPLTTEQLGLHATITVGDRDYLTPQSFELIVVSIKDVSFLVSTNRVNVESTFNFILDQVNIRWEVRFVQVLGVDVLVEDVALKEALLFGGESQGHNLLVSPIIITG